MCAVCRKFFLYILYLKVWIDEEKREYCKSFMGQSCWKSSWFMSVIKSNWKEIYAFGIFYYLILLIQNLKGTIKFMISNELNSIVSMNVYHQKLDDVKNICSIFSKLHYWSNVINLNFKAQFKKKKDWFFFVQGIFRVQLKTKTIKK